LVLGLKGRYTTTDVSALRAYLYIIHFIRWLTPPARVLAALRA
jgi:hypothetical protein